MISPPPLSPSRVWQTNPAYGIDMIFKHKFADSLWLLYKRNEDKFPARGGGRTHEEKQYDWWSSMVTIKNIREVTPFSPQALLGKTNIQEFMFLYKSCFYETQK